MDGVVAKLLQQSGETRGRRRVKPDAEEVAADRSRKTTTIRPEVESSGSL